MLKMQGSARVRTAAWFAILLAVVFGSTAVQAQDAFYYRKGEKVSLTTDATRNYVLFKEDTERETIVLGTKEAKTTLRKFEAVIAPKGLNLVAEPPAKPQKWAIIDNIGLTLQPLANSDSAKEIVYQSPFYITTDGNKKVGVSHLLFVKLKNEKDKTRLEELAKEYKVEIVGNNKLMPLWYTLSCKKESVGNALQVANKLFETGSFAAAEPDFLADFKIKCVTDTLFPQQWGLKNTGTGGWVKNMDINVCTAWNTTKGKNVVVAVLDQGVELDHPDLKNIYSKSFDTATGATSRILGNHGTACAGIIGAAHNGTNLGVAGIAPECSIMSISDELTLAPGAQQNLANGLSWAWQNGADVISNSWGHDLLASPLIDDAIEDALTRGRGGKGCVVVFAAGNNNGAVIYPANSNPAILTVGAMSYCGQRKSPTSCDPETFWGSCYGPSVDLVAPGVHIPTTDLKGPAGYDSGDFTSGFNGTSSATPHVAAVAALMLSVNPGLTQSEIVTLMEKNARKVGPYTYSLSTGRPNGDWFHEMGYGLVDAAACVKAAAPANGPKK